MSLTRNLTLPVFDFESVNDEYSVLHKQRLDWKPKKIQGDKGFSPVAQIESGFSRCVALGLELELPVGAFIRSVIERETELPKSALPGLIANIEDEEKHFDAFNLMGIKVSEEDKCIASNFRKELIQDKTHPLAKARDLESYVFLPLQGFMRMYSSEAMERVVIDISHDEYRHTQYNWMLSKDLKIPRFSNFEEKCIQIVGWCLEETDLRQTWVSICREIQYQGYSSFLEQVLNYNIHKAPFEISNSNY